MIIHKTKGDILIDDEDAGLSTGLCIKTKANGYLCVSRKIKGKNKTLARLIMNAPSGMEVDHKNHNTLDNRRCNLRVCTHTQNHRNNNGLSTRKGSKYKGVTFFDRVKYFPLKPIGKQWRAYTRINGKRVWFGYYQTEEEAARAYNENALRLFGEYACLNAV